MQYVKGSPALAEEIPMLPDRAFFDRLADAARKETLPRFRVGADVVNKEASGFDPVPPADPTSSSSTACGCNHS